MSDTTISNAKTLADNCISAFPTHAGVDVIVTRHGQRRRARVAYATLVGSYSDAAGEHVVTVDFTDSDDVINVTVDDCDIELRKQPKGHFFGWFDRLEPSPSISIAMARKLAGKAIAARKSGK